jgi:acylphosphatase
MPDIIARKVRVFGRVQGVFFRQAAVSHARTLGVEGWVRNAPDGSVEAHLKGESGAVEQMIEWMRRGPSQARVEDVTVEDVEPEEVAGFSVRI